VRDKFLNEEESSSIRKEKELEQLTIAWCAKEALYKLYGVRNLDFRENIILEIPTCAGTWFNAEISFEGQKIKYRLFSEMIGNFILVYLVDTLI
jgi:phosphopantetheinyl transferase (holo-ACP synthase)